MQGQKGTIGSFTETLNFDHGSTSSNAAMDQQLCWNSIRNPVESRLQDCLMPPNEANVEFTNSFSQQQQNASRWTIGAPSSSGSQDELNCIQRRTNNGWSSSMSACPSGGPRIEERQYGQNALLVQGSNSNAMPPNLNLNAGLMGHGVDNCQATEHSSLNKSSVSGNERIPPPHVSESFQLSPGSSEFSLGVTDGRPGSSYEGRRASCKRKALEGTVGQSSLSGSSTYLHCTESSPWPPAPAYTTASHLTMSIPPEQVNPRLGLGIRGSATSATPHQTAMSSAESSHRNFRMRINPPVQQESMSPPLFQMGDTAGHSAVSTSHQPIRFPSVDHSLDLRSTPMVDNATAQNRNSAFQAPILPPNVQPFMWNGSSAPRTSSSVNSNVSGDNEAAPRESQRLRGTINSSGRPLFVPAPESRRLVRNPPSRSSRNLNIAGALPSASRTASSSGPNQSSVNPSVPHSSSSSRYPRRLTELVRRSLLASLAPETGGQNSNHSTPPAGPPASPEMVPTAGVVNPGQLRALSRSAAWLDRHGDAAPGISSLRNLVAAGEGRTRLFVTEQIHNVLELMRRGEGLRIEDVMMLDQSGILGVADLHDRHRDMRLDVDNMSYEELLALEERIGNVSTGLNEETILKQLKQKKCSITSQTKPETDVEPCCVCQEEYNDGDDLGILNCGHDFHTDCIKQWLMQKNICPICKTTGLST